MSVYLESVVRSLELAEPDVVDGKPTDWGVAAIPAKVLANEEQTIEPAPVVASPVSHPCDPAHALVHGDKKPKSRRERIAKASPLRYVVP